MKTHLVYVSKCANKRHIHIRLKSKHMQLWKAEHVHLSLQARGRAPCRGLNFAGEIKVIRKANKRFGHG